MDKITKYILLGILLCFTWIIVFKGEQLFTDSTQIDNASCYFDELGNELCTNLSPNNIDIRSRSSDFNWWGVPPFAGKIGLLILAPYLVIHQIVKLFKRR